MRDQNGTVTFAEKWGLFSGIYLKDNKKLSLYVSCCMKQFELLHTCTDNDIEKRKWVKAKAYFENIHDSAQVDKAVLNKLKLFWRQTRKFNMTCSVKEKKQDTVWQNTEKLLLEKNQIELEKEAAEEKTKPNRIIKSTKL